jgi:hypothetical protein
LEQFKADVYGKEVQSAATYSYMWMADQMGHVCVGILVNLITTRLARYGWQLLGWQNYAETAGFCAAIALSGMGGQHLFQLRTQHHGALSTWPQVAQE